MADKVADSSAFNLICTSQPQPQQDLAGIKQAYRPLDSVRRSPDHRRSPNPYQVHALRAHALSLSQGGGPWTISDVHYVQLNGSGQEVVSVCEQYVDHLTKLVARFNQFERI